LHSRDHFVADGPDRHRAAILPAIEAAVLDEFAEQLAQLSLVKRLRLRVAIRREIERRVAAARPSPRALY
jgi:hypothetical protein